MIGANIAIARNQNHAINALAPVQIGSKLKAWYDASNTTSIVSSVGAVSLWRGLTGNSYNLAQSTGAKQPTTGTRTISSLNAIDFVAANSQSMFVDAIGSGFSGTNVAFSFYAVVQVDNTASIRTILSLESSAAANPLILLRIGATDLVNIYRRDDGGTNHTVDSTVPINYNKHIIAAVYNSTTLNLYVDGVNVLSTGLTALGALTLNRFRVGSPRELAGQYYDGIIGEILVTNGTESATDFTNIHTYLNSKWSIY